MGPATPNEPLTLRALTPDTWGDVESLFGKSGAYSGCWCMYWRTTRAEFSRQSAGGGEENRVALRALVDSGVVPGLLGYADGQPVAWCSIGPREGYASLERSRTLKRLDAEPVWSVVCFFVAPPFRRRGLMAPLLRGAVDYAAQQGARLVEAYPVVPREGERLRAADGYMGLPSVFRQAGFIEAGRPSDRRLVMRCRVGTQR